MHEQYPDIFEVYFDTFWAQFVSDDVLMKILIYHVCNCISDPVHILLVMNNMYKPGQYPDIDS